MLVELFYMTTTIWCKSPYNKDFVSALKNEIPKEYRYWDSDEKVWVVNYSYEDELIEILEEYFDDVAYYGQKKYLSTSTSQSPSAYQTLYLLQEAPKEVVMAAYRALSKLYHPDINNSPNATDKMKKINVAFDEIMGKR